MELRMMHKVHRVHTFDLAVPALSAYEALEIADGKRCQGDRLRGRGGRAGFPA
jgi:hypothetical protein